MKKVRIFRAWFSHGSGAILALRTFFFSLGFSGDAQWNNAEGYLFTALNVDL